MNNKQNENERHRTLFGTFIYHPPYLVLVYKQTKESCVGILSGFYTGCSL